MSAQRQALAAPDLIARQDASGVDVPGAVAALACRAQAMA